MPKKAVSIFFITLFTLFISAPTVISLVEKSFDTSVFFNINEEENNSSETVKIFEVKLLGNQQYYLSLLDLEKEKSYTSYLKNYTPYVTECVSPPPEIG